MRNLQIEVTNAIVSVRRIRKLGFENDNPEVIRTADAAMVSLGDLQEELMVAAGLPVIRRIEQLAPGTLDPRD